MGKKNVNWALAGQIAIAVLSTVLNKSTQGTKNNQNN